jgi:hypothetical protein
MIRTEWYSVLFLTSFRWGMDKFTLEHRVFLYDAYVKCKSARKCQKIQKEVSWSSGSP